MDSALDLDYLTELLLASLEESKFKKLADDLSEYPCLSCGEAGVPRGVTCINCGTDGGVESQIDLGRDILKKLKKHFF